MPIRPPDNRVRASGVSYKFLLYFLYENRATKMGIPRFSDSHRRRVGMTFEPGHERPEARPFAKIKAQIEPIYTVTYIPAESGMPRRFRRSR
jgi:hypothetical protein